MSQAIEREFKAPLTAAQFTRLQADYHFQPPFSQTNYYFELPAQDLTKRHWGLRIRVFATYAEQTLKVPTSQKAHCLLEITDRLKLSQARALIKAGQIAPGQITAYLTQQQVAATSLFIWGSATTTRQTCQLPAGLLTLDQTQYPDQTSDFELELEVTSLAAGTRFFEQLTVDYQISNQRPQNKIARAFIHQG